MTVGQDLDAKLADLAQQVQTLRGDVDVHSSALQTAASARQALRDDVDELRALLEVRETPPTPPEPPAPTEVLVDDFDSEQAALDAVTDGRLLVFPARDYHLNAPLVFRSGNRVHSDGKFFQHAEAPILHFRTIEDVKVSGFILHHLDQNHPGGPNPILVEGSHDLEFLQTTIERADSWGFFITHDGVNQSFNILIDGYTNRNREYESRNIDDGLDIVGHDITVRHADIATNDDAISFKTLGGLGDTYNILIEDSVIRSRDGGITWGTEFGTRNLRDITVRRVHFDNVGRPIWFKLYENQYKGQVINTLIEDCTSVSTGNTGRLIDAWYPSTVSSRDRVDALIRNFSHTGGFKWQKALIVDQPRLRLENVTA